MSWGTLFRENRWQKLFSIGMAVLIWLTVPSTQGFRISRAGDSELRVFPAVPITVLAKASSLGRYQVTPSTVRVELRGDPEVLDRILPSELEAYVNLVDLRATPQLIFLHVNPPPGSQLISVDPIKVLVDRIPSE